MSSILPLRTVVRHPGKTFAACVLIQFILAAIAAEWIAPYDPYAISEAYLEPPSWSHPLGTDALGRDLLSRIIYGSRFALSVAGGAVGLSLVAGTTLGVLAGYGSGWIDAVFARLFDVMFAIPEVLLALAVIALVGPGLWQMSLAIGIVYTPIFARVTRGSVMIGARRQYVEAAHALGVSEPTIIWRHILPEARRPLIIQTTLSLAFAVLAEAALSFLGLSGQTDAPSWGLMLRQGKDLMELAWWVAVFPGLAITLLVVSLNMLGD
jgi:peptide/nickel transport system permease protein